MDKVFIHVSISETPQADRNAHFCVICVGSLPAWHSFIHLLKCAPKQILWHSTACTCTFTFLFLDAAFSCIQRSMAAFCSGWSFSVFLYFSFCRRFKIFFFFLEALHVWTIIWHLVLDAAGKILTLTFFFFFAQLLWCVTKETRYCFYNW